MKIIESDLDRVKVAVMRESNGIWISLTLPDQRAAGVRLSDDKAHGLIKFLIEAREEKP